MLTVTPHHRAGTVHLSLVGRLDGSPCCDSLTTEVKSALQEGQRQIVLDLSGLDWLTSCGIGCLVRNFVSTRNAGGRLVLLSPNRRVLRALTVTDLVPKVFEVVHTRALTSIGLPGGESSGSTAGQETMEEFVAGDPADSGNVSGAGTPGGQLPADPGGLSRREREFGASRAAP